MVYLFSKSFLFVLCRFRTTETAAEFKKVFDQCRGSATQTSPQKVEVLTQQGQAEATTMKKELFKDIQDGQFC